MPAVEEELPLNAALAAIASLEGALRDSEAERFALFETSPCGRAYVDPFSGRLLRANRRFSKVTGYVAEELLDHTWFEILTPEERERHAEDLERLARGYVQEASFEASCVRKDGEIFHARIWAVVVRDESWRPLRTVVTIEERA